MNKRLRIIIIALVVICFITPVYMAISGKNDKKISNAAQSTNGVKPIAQSLGKSVHLSEPDKIVKATKAEIDIDKAKLTSEIEETIRNADKENAERNVRDFKSIVVEFEIPDQYQEELVQLVKKVYSVPDICIAYEFLVDGYGSMSDLKALLEEKKGGKEWSGIFRNYWNAYDNYVPRNLPSGYVEELLNTTKLNTDDITIADRISQKYKMDYDGLIAQRKQGNTWREININLNILNLEERMPVISVDDSEVNKYVKDTGISKRDITGAMITAYKLRKSEDEIINKVKGGIKKEDIYSKVYIEKYKGGK